MLNSLCDIQIDCVDQNDVDDEFLTGRIKTGVRVISFIISFKGGTLVLDFTDGGSVALREVDGDAPDAYLLDHLIDRHSKVFVFIREVDPDLTRRYFLIFENGSVGVENILIPGKHYAISISDAMADFSQPHPFGSRREHAAPDARKMISISDEVAEILSRYSKG